LAVESEDGLNEQQIRAPDFPKQEKQAAMPLRSQEVNKIRDGNIMMEHYQCGATSEIIIQ
jgi:hypothetical protein